MRSAFLCHHVMYIFIWSFHILIHIKSMRAQDLLEVNYNNIQDTGQLRALAQSYNLHIQELVKQLQDLGHLRDRSQAENDTIVRKMSDMEKANEARIRQYEESLAKAAISFKQKAEEITSSHSETLKVSGNKHVLAMESLEAETKQLQGQYSVLSEYELEEENLLQEIKQKSGNLVLQQYKHHDNMNKQELKQMQQNKLLFEKNWEMIKELRKDVRQEAGKIVYKEKYVNEDRNYELKVRLLDLQDEVARLRRDRNEILKTRNEQKINTSLNEEQIEEYKAVGSIQKSKIKMYTDKVESTKKMIQGELAKLEAKIREKTNKWQGELKGTNLKLLNLQKQKQELRANIQKYRILGETILMQRQEVEQFFLMSIEACKREMAESGSMLESTQKQYGEKVDIDELLPKDKHRIITNLYTKLALAPSK